MLKESILFKTGFLVTIAGVLALHFISCLVIYFYKFHSGFSADQAVWGQYGDLFGGILNPTLSFLTLMALIITIKYQVQGLELSREEIKLSREELELSRVAIESTTQEVTNQNKKLEQQIFETTFFNLVNFSHNIVNSIDLSKVDSKNSLSVSIGRDCFRFLFNNQFQNSMFSYLKEYYLIGKTEKFILDDEEMDSISQWLPKGPTEYANIKEGIVYPFLINKNLPGFYTEMSKMDYDFKVHLAKIIYEKFSWELKSLHAKKTYKTLSLALKYKLYCDCYLGILNKYGSFFEHYFKNIESIIQFVDRSNLDLENKENYIQILLSQLSNFEIIGLYYYCLGSPLSDNLINLIQKYDIFKDLRKEDLYEPADFDEMWQLRCKNLGKAYS